ncbi:DNA-binding response regulator [Streptomyces sp. NPDC006514]|uniref:DNA-binding response regulator n=1 Tax=Streptomyces sp. NPDC006514 TaxID=3154308 RepID=UPI0033BCE0C2
MPVDHREGRALRVLLEPPNPALALQLGLQPDIEVVRDPMARPAVALVEELAAVTALLADDPECRVLVLTGSAHPGLAEAALAAGAVGLVLRDGPVGDLANSVRRASMGETVVDPALG